MGARPLRILCLWFPAWTLQRLLVARPELERCLLLLTEPLRRGAFVRYCNLRAQRRGVRAGMPLAEAQTFARRRDRLVVEAVQPRHDRQALVQLALRCERFSFCIGLEAADRPECVLMDVTGLAHFFAGEEALAAELARTLAGERYDGRIAIGETLGAAWAAAHFLAAPQRPAVIPAGELRRLEALPAEGLRLEAAAAAKLRRLAIETIGQVLALDRAALARRLGKETLLRIDQFVGGRTEPIVPCQPQPRYRVERRLETGIAQPDRIVQLESRLLGELLALLAPLRLGMRRLECGFTLEDRTAPTLGLRFCEATNDPRHIGDLLRLKQEGLRLTAPVVALQMEAGEVVPLEAVQPPLFEGGARGHARQFAMLLNRLSSRLGEAAVLAAAVRPDPIPERAVRLQPVADAAAATLASCAAESAARAATSSPCLARWHALDRPTVLFAEPRPIEVLAATPDGPPAALFWQTARFEIARHSEPERIESGWWRGEYVCRDYYRLETTAGQWLWVFRRLQDGRWFWHGELH